MKTIILVLLLTVVIACPSWASDIDRFQTQGQVILEKYPEQMDVMQVFLRPGFATKLEFEEGIELTVNGNNSMMSLIESKDKKSLIVYPRQSVGVTNLLVDTEKRKLNYEVVIGNKDALDYRIRGGKNIRKVNNSEEDIPFKHLVRLATNYDTLKDLGILNEKQFGHKDVFETFNNNGVTLVLKKILSYRNPHYLFFEIEIVNETQDTLEINRKKSVVLVNEKEFAPVFTALYSSTLLPNESTDGWIVLDHTQLSMENEFKFTLEINYENRLFN